MAITYRCDRCKRDVEDVADLFEVQLLFIPWAGEDLDREERKYCGHVCRTCRQSTLRLVNAAVENRAIITARKAKT